MEVPRDRQDKSEAGAVPMVQHFRRHGLLDPVGASLASPLSWLHPRGLAVGCQVVTTRIWEVGPICAYPGHFCILIVKKKKRKKT